MLLPKYLKLLLMLI